jgi:hypothetical protein
MTHRADRITPAQRIGATPLPVRTLGQERRAKIDFLATLLYDVVNPNQDTKIVYSKAFCIRAIERLIDLQNEFSIPNDGYELVDILVPVFARASSQ